MYAEVNLTLDRRNKVLAIPVMVVSSKTAVESPLRRSRRKSANPRSSRKSSTMSISALRRPFSSG